VSENFLIIEESTYAPFRNLGGYDYLGKAEDMLRTKEQLEVTMKTCKNMKLTGLILTGATNTLTDAAYLAEFFLESEINTKVIAIPATVDGNIHH
jgi:pyrophosphate--fructose-6-phosphate 1-phosphotransferase